MWKRRTSKERQIVHIEGNIKNRDRFTPQLYQLSENEYALLDDYKIRNKGRLFLMKELTLDEQTIVEDIVKELNRIVFLEKYIDQLMNQAM